METLDPLAFESKLVKVRFFKAATEGRLKPIFNEQCELDVEYAKENGFTKEHIFVLRDIFKHRMNGKTNEEVLDFANEIMLRTLRMREIYDNLDAIVADKKEKGIY